jgi:hypothetical protein
MSASLSRSQQKKLDKELKEQRWKDKKGKKKARKAGEAQQPNKTAATQSGLGKKRPREDGEHNPSGQADAGKKKNKKGGGKNGQPAAAPVLSDEVQAVIKSLGTSSGTLSDRLNPDHPKFDAALKANWKQLGKKGRAAIVEADKKRLAVKLALSSSIEHPFKADSADHCETPPQAYRDVAPLLDLLATTLGKTRATLRIFDPYFCAGTMKAHLGELGFLSVHNECADFYTNIREGRLPPHDVLLTNPPYSGDHVERLLRFVATNAKPFLLLMPNYFCAKPYFLPALTEAPPAKSASAGGGSSSHARFQSEPGVAAGGGQPRSSGPAYLCPIKRYCYWTPKGLRAKDQVQAHVSTLGYRTSPFISFWYCDLDPTCTRAAMAKAVKQEQAERGNAAPFLCADLAALPQSVRDGMGR